ncbi:MAG: TetR family transcriptional regulator [Methylophilaceae bacterium]|nr:MAG: TetR family transcriptional regulator [Methylophilaceae bacterium]
MQVNENLLDCQNLPSRSDGEKSRARLVYIALKLFAEQGYEKTSIRQIAKEAEVNISAIAYYFGDKAGLYRVVFTEPMGSAKDDIHLFDGEALSLEEALRGLYQGFIEPLKQGEIVQLCTRLHMREMVEPTGLWEEEVDQSIAPYHHALNTVLQRHLNVESIDDDLHRLSMAIVALGVHLYTCRDVTDRISPKLMATNESLDVMCERLTMYGVSMVNAEAERRRREK